MGRFGGYPIEVIHELRIPGLPEEHSLCLADAERSGVEFPEYSVSEVSRFIFQRHHRWLRRTLEKVAQPELGGGLYYSPYRSTGSGLQEGHEVQRYSLSEVERMIVHFFEQGEIEEKAYVVARQIVAWIARGHGFYNG